MTNLRKITQCGVSPRGVMNKNFTFGMLTLGQSPRTDIEPTFRAIWGEGVLFMQRGGLDGLSIPAIAQLAPTGGEPGIETCVTSPGNGRLGVFVSKKHLLPRLVSAAHELEMQCHNIVLLCSGQFPALKQAVPKLIEPIVFIRSVVASLAGHAHVCVIGPESDMAEAPAQWSPYVAKVSVAAASPYDPGERLVQAACRAREIGADYILLDDMGFTEEQRRLVRAISGIVTLNATSIAARVLQELV